MSFRRARLRAAKDPTPGFFTTGSGGFSSPFIPSTDNYHARGARCQSKVSGGRIQSRAYVCIWLPLSVAVELADIPWSYLVYLQVHLPGRGFLLARSSRRWQILGRKPAECRIWRIAW